MSTQNLANVELIPFPAKGDMDSFLNVYEGDSGVPFTIKRVFTVTAKKTLARGFHAHKECTQLLVALNGVCEVTCDDGYDRVSFRLDSSEKGLLIPPSIWAEQSYTPGTVLMVLTNMPYDESDYIRNYEEFLTLKGVA